jgi:two-component system response regulator FixJ
MPGMSGLELQEYLMQNGNHMPTIMITGHADIAMAVRAMKAGAFDFIMKPFNSQFLLEKVQEAIKLDKKRINAHQHILITRGLKQLTARELEVLELITSGKLNREISNLLGISISTVEMHRANIMKKMHATSIAGLVKNYLILKSGIFCKP